MDYPHPKIQLKGNDIDISAPYGVGVGPWDNFAIAYGYSDEGDVTAQLALQNQLLAEVARKGLRYIGEADSRQRMPVMPMQVCGTVVMIQSLNYWS